jgi:hypothetical protein
MLHSLVFCEKIIKQKFIHLFMTALIPRLKKYLQKNPLGGILIGGVVFISALMLVVGFYLLGQ